MSEKLNLYLWIWSPTHTRAHAHTHSHTQSTEIALTLQDTIHLSLLLELRSEGIDPVKRLVAFSHLFISEINEF